MPMKLADYCDGWPEISRRARESAGWKCVDCGVTNGAVGSRDRHGVWWNEDAIHGMNYDVGFHLFGGAFPKMIRIVLTCHHPNHDKANPDAAIEPLCQRCHLNKDRAHHLAKAAETRRRRKLARTGRVALGLEVAS